MQLDISAHDEYYPGEFLAVFNNQFTLGNLSEEHVANEFSDETLWTNAEEVVKFKLEVIEKLRH